VTYILHIETSTKVCSVALSFNGACLDFITESSSDFVHSERLNMLIGDLLQQCGIGFSDLAAVAVSSGPGSYTGLRIGVSTAKGLCYALSIPLIAIDSLSALAGMVRGQRNISESLVLSMIDARRMEAYTSLFDSNYYPIKPVSADIFDEMYLSELSEQQHVILVGDAQEKCRDLWAARKNFHFSGLEADARGQIELAYEKFQNADFADLVYFEPQYFKDFQPGVKAK
jgi:tRNA threonylcarbamoyladenosine biosynthesis protein TsaB